MRTDNYLRKFMKHDTEILLDFDNYSVLHDTIRSSFFFITGLEIILQAWHNLN